MIRLSKMGAGGTRAATPTIKRRPRSFRVKWTPVEDKQLMDYVFHNYSNKGIATLMGRSVGAIAHRLKILRAKRNEKNSEKASV